MSVDDSTTPPPEQALSPEHQVAATQAVTPPATPNARAGLRDFVVISKFVIANDMSLQVKEAFRNRPHKVDDAEGFLRMDVISPLDDPNEIWLMTFWRDESSFRTWHRSHQYHESHAGIPKGLKLKPKSVTIRCFEGIAS